MSFPKKGNRAGFQNIVCL